MCCIHVLRMWWCEPMNNSQRTYGGDMLSAQNYHFGISGWTYSVVLVLDCEGMVIQHRGKVRVGMVNVGDGHGQGEELTRRLVCVQKMSRCGCLLAVDTEARPRKSCAPSTIIYR